MSNLVIKKQVKNAIWYESGLIKIENVRASYPHLGKPYAGKGGDDDANKNKTPKYGIVGMLPKSSHLEAKNLVIEAMNHLLSQHKEGGEIPKIAAAKKFIRDGDQEDNESYANHWIVSAREERRPSVRDARANLITEPAEITEKIYGGCWVSILIRPWYQDGKKVGAGFGKRVNAGLQGVQFLRDDKPFGEGRIDDTEAWGDETAKSGGGDGMDDDDDGL